MALLHANGNRLARIVSITSTDPQPISSIGSEETVHDATRAFLASSTQQQQQHGGKHGQAVHLERHVVHPGWLAKLQYAFPGQEVAARALLDIALAMAPCACSSMSPLALLHRVRKVFSPTHWMSKDLYLGWLEEDGMDDWSRISDAICDVRYGYDGLRRDVGVAREVVHQGLLSPIVEWAMTMGNLDKAGAQRWLSLLTDRERHETEIRSAVKEVEGLMQQHVLAAAAAKTKTTGGLMPCSFSLPDHTAGLPLVAYFETFPEEATCRRRPGEMLDASPLSIFERAGLDGARHGDLTASLTFAGPAELVAAADGISVPDVKPLFDLATVTKSYSRRLVANLCDVNEGGDDTTNKFPCPSVELWNERIESLAKLVVLSEPFPWPFLSSSFQASRLAVRVVAAAAAAAAAAALG